MYKSTSTTLPNNLNNLTQCQINYFHDQHRFVILPAGRRSRKTLISKRKVLISAVSNQEHRYFHGAPTRQQAKDIFWKDLKQYTKALWGKQPNETALYVTLMNGSEIHVIGLDKPERVEGQPWHGCHITEIGNVKETAWPENIRPLLSDTNGFALLDGVPEGRNHYYDLALKACGGIIPSTVPIQGAFGDSEDDPEWCYYSWFSSDVLSEAEIASARRDLDDRTFRQEYEGAFESYEGLAYVEFGKHNLDMIKRDENKQISIGMDFNIDPITATLGHIVGDSYYQFGEIYLSNSNTYEMQEYLSKLYEPHEVVIYPDSTGKHENSNATISDIAILQKAGFSIKAKSSNPFVVDRVNAVNSLMKKRDKTRYKINPETCPKTMNDINKVERLADGRLNKNQERQGLKHITDALGYLIDNNWPVKSRVAWTG